MTDFAKGSHNLPSGEISNHYTWGYMLLNGMASDQRYKDSPTRDECPVISCVTTPLPR